jgi:hypothetical protein|tara:strand:+ start:638 stop:997 length:360 start_codon:yes stop_codon:yes gene_type:complete
MEDVTDICSLMMAALIDKEITSGQSREIRQWAELMFTSVQAVSGADQDINYITQLIQMNNIAAPEQLAEPQAEFIDVIEATPSENSREGEPISTKEEPRTIPCAMDFEYENCASLLIEE